MMNAMSQISAIARKIQFNALRFNDWVMNDTINISINPSKILTAIVSRKTVYNEKNRIVKDGRDYSRFYEEPLITNFDFGIKKDTGSSQVKKVKQHFSYGTDKQKELERLELKKREIEKLIEKLSKTKN